MSQNNGVALFFECVDLHGNFGFVAKFKIRHKLSKPGFHFFIKYLRFTIHYPLLRPACLTDKIQADIKNFG